MHPGERDAGEQSLVEQAGDRVGLEEPGAVPLAAGPERGVFPAFVDDGRQLGEVADQYGPEAAERPPVAARLGGTGRGSP